MTTPIDSTAAQKALDSATAIAKKTSTDLASAQAQLKKATSANKAALQSRVNSLTSALTLANNNVTKAQNTVYEVTGQYDKLLTGTTRDAFMAVKSLFQSYDLGSLAPKIYEYVKNGFSSDTISIMLQDTSEYKARFAGNEARKAAGLPVLSPAEYLSTETSYKQIMSSAGLPSGFYDQPSDLSSWIGKDVSPTEVQSRVDMATQATILSNPTYRKALNQMGIGNSELTAYFLDQGKALPYLQKAAATAQIGAEALSQGLTFDQGYASDLATLGITRDEAKAGYSTIAGEQVQLSQLAGIYGQSWSQREAEKAVFESNADELNKKQKLIGQETAAFSGATGGGRSGLASTGGAR